MATNPNVNKVVYGNDTIMDITDTTAEPSDVAVGEVFYTRSGARAVGTGDYMGKVQDPSAGDVLVTDAGGQAQDSGVPLASLATKEYTDDKCDAAIVYTIDYTTVKIAEELAAFDHLDYQIVQTLPATGEAGVRYLVKHPTDAAYEEHIYVDGQWHDIGPTNELDIELATDSVAGVVKTNGDQAVTLDADGRLVVGGRMGQFPSTTGMYAPNNRDPQNVGNYSLLMTDAMGMDMPANRSLAVVSGYGIACRSAAAGATEYRIQNNYNNRIIAMLCVGGYAAKDEATSTQKRVVPVVSVTIGGSAYTPDSSANPSGTANDIVIKTSETLNPDGATTNIRLFGKMGSYATLHVGNGITSEGGGRNLLLGGGVTKAGSSNDNCLIGNGIYSSGNGNAAFGRYHIMRKNRGFVAGTGHDTTNAPSEGASAVGQYSSIGSTTLFAVGNGTSHTARSNAFEVTSDGAIVLKSPNGTRYKVAVDDSGNLTTTAV